MVLYFRGYEVISGPWNFYLRTKQHDKADKCVDISEAVSDSDEEFYLVVCRFYPCIAQPNPYRVKNAYAIAFNLPLKLNKGRNPAPLRT